MKIKCDTDLPENMKLDSLRFKQIMVNLLSNSIRFTFHGTIKVSLNYDVLKEELNVTVSDTGIGIRDEDKKLILEMFSNHKAPTISTNTSNPSIGLSISS
jgi:signal transduction histidine kinase